MKGATTKPIPQQSKTAISISKLKSNFSFNSSIDENKKAKTQPEECISNGVKYTKLNNQNIKAISFIENEKRTSSYIFSADGKIQRRFASYHGPKRSKYICDNKAFDSNVKQPKLVHQSSVEIDTNGSVDEFFDCRTSDSNSEKDNAILIASDNYGMNRNDDTPVELYISYDNKINSLGNDIITKNMDSLIENDFNEELVTSFEEKKVTFIIISIYFLLF